MLNGRNMENRGLKMDYTVDWCWTDVGSTILLVRKTLLVLSRSNDALSSLVDWQNGDRYVSITSFYFLFRETQRTHLSLSVHLRNYFSFTLCVSVDSEASYLHTISNLILTSLLSSAHLHLAVRLCLQIQEISTFLSFLLAYRLAPRSRFDKS
jgi:hypothetical protein